jgi:hypothetical protein
MSTQIEGSLKRRDAPVKEKVIGAVVRVVFASKCELMLVGTRHASEGHVKAGPL